MAEQDGENLSAGLEKMAEAITRDYSGLEEEDKEEGEPEEADKEEGEPEEEEGGTPEPEKKPEETPVELPDYMKVEVQEDLASEEIVPEPEAGPVAEPEGIPGFFGMGTQRPAAPAPAVAPPVQQPGPVKKTHYEATLERLGLEPDDPFSTPEELKAITHAMEADRRDEVQAAQVRQETQYKQQFDASWESQMRGLNTAHINAGLPANISPSAIVKQFGGNLSRNDQLRVVRSGNKAAEVCVNLCIKRTPELMAVVSKLQSKVPVNGQKKEMKKVNEPDTEENEKRYPISPDDILKQVNAGKLSAFLSGQ